MPDLDLITRRLAVREPTLIEDPEHRRAAVAMILRDRPGGPEVLFIERARREGDPWSGHMAFPGGRVDPTDDGVRAAAERETLEEVGIPLRGATTLGRLDDKAGNPHGKWTWWGDMQEASATYRAGFLQGAFSHTWNETVLEGEYNGNKQIGNWTTTTEGEVTETKNHGGQRTQME